MSTLSVCMAIMVCSIYMAIWGIQYILIKGYTVIGWYPGVKVTQGVRVVWGYIKYIRECNVYKGIRGIEVYTGLWSVQGYPG